MVSKIIMPQAGQDIEKGTVVRWLKHEGDPVAEGEVVCEVETEKATFEVTAPVEGYLRKILVPAGHETRILAAIGVIGGLNDAIEDIAEPSVVTTRTPDAAQNAPAHSKATGEAGPQAAEKEARISPKARRLADENHIPIHELAGSGPMGRIVEKDVLDYLQKQNAYRTSAPNEHGERRKKVVRLDKVRKVTALKMRQSKQAAPHFYVTKSIDMTAALKYRGEINSLANLPQNETISINDLILRACALALKEFPEINASYVDEDTVVLWEDINLGIAVSLEDGLAVPVLEHADRLDLRQLSRKSLELTESARNGKQISLAPGGFTVTNLGMYNIENFIAIINPPEAAILAVSTIVKSLVVRDDLTIAVRDMMNATLSIDHRVCDGVMACRFLNRVGSLLETPETLGAGLFALPTRAD